MNSTVFDCVLFDLDGTLADTVPLIIASFQRTTAELLGRPASEADSRQWIGRSLRETFTALAPDRVDELTAHYLSWNLANHRAYVRPFEGVPELVDALAPAGRNFGVATSKRYESAVVTLDCAGLAGRIRLLATEEDTAAHKPSPEPLLHALAVVGVDPAEAVYVGDTVVDLQAAHAAGMASIAVTWGAATRDELAGENPSAIVETPGELRALLGV